jgi:hypothetical protein
LQKAGNLEYLLHVAKKYNTGDTKFLSKNKEAPAVLKQGL